MTRGIIKGLATGAALAALTGTADADTFWIDLSHPIPTFHAVEGSPLESDLNAPWLDSTPHVGFAQQAILTIGVWPTNTGHFDSGTLIIDEHYGTHLDSTNHFLNNDETMIEGGIEPADRLDSARLTPDHLIGPIVLIDIGPRVQAELDKNGGVPSPDPSVTDFSDATGAVVGPDDIDAIADQLEDGAWIIVNQEWAQFYFDGGADYRHWSARPGRTRQERRRAESRSQRHRFQRCHRSGRRPR